MREMQNVSFYNIYINKIKIINLAYLINRSLGSLLASSASSRWRQWKRPCQHILMTQTCQMIASRRTTQLCRFAACQWQIHSVTRSFRSCLSTHGSTDSSCLLFLLTVRSWPSTRRSTPSQRTLTLLISSSCSSTHGKWVWRLLLWDFSWERTLI